MARGAALVKADEPGLRLILRATALAICLVLALEGCSFGIAAARLGPHPGRDIKVGTKRSEVERLLGKPITEDPAPGGQVRAVYEYTVREKSEDWLRDMADPRYVLQGVFMLEPLLTPLVYFTKSSVTYQVEYFFGSDETVVEPLPRADFNWVRACSGPLIGRKCSEPARPTE